MTGKAGVLDRDGKTDFLLKERATKWESTGAYDSVQASLKPIRRATIARRTLAHIAEVPGKRMQKKAAEYRDPAAFFVVIDNSGLSKVKLDRELQLSGRVNGTRQAECRTRCRTSQNKSRSIEPGVLINVHKREITPTGCQPNICSVPDVKAFEYQTQFRVFAGADGTR